VQVEDVTVLTTDTAAASFVLPSKLTMNPSDLANFSASIFPNTKTFEPWYTSHQGSAIGFGFTTLTLRGNEKDQIRITGMNVIKSCRAPLNGTYFAGYSQGTADNIGIAFDLDAANPMSQDMAMAATGITPLGTDFFAAHTVTLNHGETETLSVGAYTKKYACTFTLRMIVATSSGSFIENIDDNGKPFVVTAQINPINPDAKYSGYQAAYVDGPSGWAQVDPATHK
jgi:hypothetical protein